MKKKPGGSFWCGIHNMSEEMLSLAREGERAARDDGCRILYSILRDQAYCIRRQVARRESPSYPEEES